MAAAPTVVPKSPAICGSSESVTRTWAWLAKPATASSTIDRVGFGWAAGVGIAVTGRGICGLVGNRDERTAVDSMRTGALFTARTGETETTMIDKTYQPAEVEKRIDALWEEAGAFRAGRPERREAEPYCIVIPPPNVTGSLHMGHALNNTLQDVLCRFERMRGKDVLWQVGTDHAGIATQMVVERQLMERQEPGRRALGREKFLEKVWAWKAESGGTIINQLKRLGASCDWSRERFTMDEGLSKAVIRVFVALYRAGLIYKDKRLVNWDPKLLTAISDLEVQQVESKGHLWHFHYPLEGAGDGFITVATTRPETMLGDTAVAVHPDDERYRHLVGKHAILPLVGRRIPIVADEYSDPEKGTGAVKITPAHDFNDFEVGRRHDLPLINVLDREANLNLENNDAFLDGLDPMSPELVETLQMHGLDRFVARRLIVERMQDLGLVAKIEPHVNMVPHGDRSGVDHRAVPDRPVVRRRQDAGAAGGAGGARRPHHVRAAAVGGDLFQLDGQHPALVHLAPALVGPSDSGLVRLGARRRRPTVDREDGSVRRRDRGGGARSARKNYYKKDVVLVGSMDESLAKVGLRRRGCRRRCRSGATRTCSTPGSRRRCGRSRRWAGRTRPTELKRFYPTNVLVTGFDIIFFWVARMMMMGLHFMKDIPFHTVYIHRARARRARAEDVEVEGQRHRSARASSTSTAPMRCASRWRAWRRKATTSSCRRSASRATATSRPSCGTPRASPR